MHHIDIHIPDTNRLTSFIVRDASQYDDNLPVEDGWLEVYAPSSTQPMLWKVDKNFSITINSNLLHLTTGILSDLPDGTYYIRYSVKPNTKVFVQYPYYRVSKLLNDYFGAVTDAFRNRNRSTNKNYNIVVKELSGIKDLIDASRYMAEDNHNLEEANLMYTEANSRLNKLCYTSKM